MLSERQRSQYRDEGWISVPRAWWATTGCRGCAAFARELLEPSRTVTGSNAMFDLYCGDESVGALSDEDVQRADVGRAEYPAGTIIVHSCRTVHGSDRNASDRVRPVIARGSPS